LVIRGPRGTHSRQTLGRAEAHVTWLIWTGFLAFVFVMLALDLGVFHRKSHAVGVKEALGWSAVWIGLALLFGVFVYFAYENHWLGIGLTPDATEQTDQFPNGRINDGRAAVAKYLTGYVVEKSLSIDNIFVIVLIFAFFGVPAAQQHRVLFWGILGALALRGAMIGVGAVLIERFHWILYVFGAFLILTALKMLLSKAGHGEPGDNAVVRLVRRIFPVTDQFHGEHFLVRDHLGRRVLTPLALALVVVETTDLVFAVDSIPAVFAITADPFLVFTSNVFAMLGLRSLYFALAGLVTKFRYLKVSLAVILAAVGAKMLAERWVEHVLGEAVNFYFLGFVLLVLSAGVGASLWVGRRVVHAAPAR
jgi:tellurite resistance protein TerC